LEDMGYEILSTRGTAKSLQRGGVAVTVLNKVKDGGDTVLSRLKQIAFVVNTPSNKGAKHDEAKIRSACAVAGKPYFTTLSSATALIGALRQLKKQDYGVAPLQEILPARGVWRAASTGR